MCDRVDGRGEGLGTCFSCLFVFIYLKVQQGEREFFLCWFIPQVPPAVRDGPGKSQESGTSISIFPVSGLDLEPEPEPLSAASEARQQEAGWEAEAGVGLHCWKWEAHSPGVSSMCCVAIAALKSRVFKTGQNFMFSFPSYKSDLLEMRRI